MYERMPAVWFGLPVFWYFGVGNSCYVKQWNKVQNPHFALERIALQFFLAPLYVTAISYTGTKNLVLRII